MTQGLRVMPADVVASGSCIAGARQWFETYGFDFRTFIREGVDIETLRALDCPLANRACDAAEKRAAQGDNQ